MILRFPHSPTSSRQLSPVHPTRLQRIGPLNHESAPHVFTRLPYRDPHSVDFRRSWIVVEAWTALGMVSASLLPCLTVAFPSPGRTSPHRRPLRSNEVPQSPSVSLTETQKRAGPMERQSRRMRPESAVLSTRRRESKPLPQPKKPRALLPLPR